MKSNIDLTVDKAWLDNLRENINLPADIDTIADNLDAMGDSYGDDYYEAFDKAIEVDKPKAPQINIEEAIKMMEENEDTVECAYCNELVEKTSCTKNKAGRYVCVECSKNLLESGRNIDTSDESLKDAITHAEDLADVYDGVDAKKENEQIKKWLSELQDRRKNGDKAKQVDDKISLDKELDHLQDVLNISEGDAFTETKQLIIWLQELKDARNSDVTEEETKDTDKKEDLKEEVKVEEPITKVEDLSEKEDDFEIPSTLLDALNTEFPEPEDLTEIWKNRPADWPVVDKLEILDIQDKVDNFDENDPKRVIRTITVKNPYGRLPDPMNILTYDWKQGYDSDGNRARLKNTHFDTWFTWNGNVYDYDGKLLPIDPDDYKSPKELEINKKIAKRLKKDGLI